MKLLKEHYDFERLDEDLDWCPEIGVAWQKLPQPFEYKEEYWDNYVVREHTPIGRLLNQFRCSLAEKYSSSVLDIGIGCGEFLKKLRIPGLGYDINPIAIKWLKDRELFADPYVKFPSVDGVTLWDTLEHMPNPDEFLGLIPQSCHLFISLPVFSNFKQLKKSKHFKKNEHLLYVSEKGLVAYLDLFGFELLEIRDDEVKAGREEVKTFVFKKE